MSQTQKPQPTRPNTTYATATRTSAAPIVEEADDWLDAIDEALEENVLEVVRTFRQKGGQ